MHTGYNVNVEEARVASLISYQVDGIILSEPEHTPLTVKRLIKSEMPVAEIMSVPEDPINVAIGIKHEDVTYAVTKSLIECGRKNIAYFGVRLDRRTMDRQKGYQRALDEFNLEPHIYSSAVHSTFTVGNELLTHALNNKDKLDAIITTNDDVAVGVLISCQHYGIKVPEDLAVIGYNGLSYCDASIPRLCSICTPRYEIGKLAVDEIVSQLKSNYLSPRTKYLHCSLTHGGSLTEKEQRAVSAALASM